MNADVTAPLRPRHRLSPRARRLAAEADIAGMGTPLPRSTASPAAPPPAMAAFAVAEIEIDVTGLGDDVVAHVAKAAAEAMPADPVHLAVEPNNAVAAGPATPAAGPATPAAAPATPDAAPATPAGAPATPDVAAAAPAIGPSLIRDAGDLSLAGVRRRLRGDGAAPVSGDATFTLTVSGLTAETVPPEPGQAGTLVLGATAERAAVVRLADGSPGIAVRSLARLTFSYDHRSFGRAEAIRFLTAVRHRLEQP